MIDKDDKADNKKNWNVFGANIFVAVDPHGYDLSFYDCGNLNELKLYETEDEIEIIYA